MEGAAGLAIVVLGLLQVVYLVTVSTLGVRLCLRALALRERPELLLGLHFTLCCSLGYALLSVAFSASLDPRVAAAPWVVPVVALGQLLSAAGVWSVLAFTQLVFRPESRPARAVVWLGGAAFAAGWVGSALGGGFSGRVDAGWFRFLYGLYMLVALWVLFEPLRYWVVMRRRLRLGLAEPLLVDRFLLWGAGSLCRFGMLLVGIVASFAPSLATDPAVVLVTLSTTAFLGLGVAITYWLAFFPPPSYARSVARRALRAA